MPKARVQQMQDRVFRPADVAVHGAVGFFNFRVHQGFVIVRVHITQIIPAGAGPLRHGVGFAFSRSAALGASGVDPLRRIGQRGFPVAGRLKIFHVGQLQRQLVLGQRHYAAFVAVHQRNRFAPVALTRKHPVAQFVHGFSLARAFFFQPFNHFGFAFAHAQTVQKAGVDQLSVSGKSFFFYAFFAFDDFNDFQAEFFGKRIVALVVRRHGHNGPRAVAHQHIVRRPDGYLFAVDGINGVSAGKHAGFFFV